MKNIHYILCLLLLCVVFTSHGQTFDIKLFENTRGNTIGEVEKNKAELDQITKENKAFVKEQRKKYKAMRDSLDALKNTEWPKDSTSRVRRLQKQHYLFTNEWYSEEEIAKWDSVEQQSKKELLEYSKDRLEGNYYYDKYTGLNDKIIGYRSELKDYQDSLKNYEDDKEKREYLIILKKQELSEKYGKELEERAVKEATARGQVALPTNNPELEKVLQYKDLADETLNVNQSKTKGVNYFEGKEEVLANAMSQSAELKEKYSKVVDSNDLSTATKRNSLAGTRFWGRLVFGGTFQIHIDQQTSIDLNPELAYRINKKWDVGIGGNYRLNGEIDDLLGQAQETQVYGYRVFTEYFLFKGFHAHLEFESLAAKPMVASDNGRVAWNQSLLAGLERRFNLGENTQAQISLLYNFMHKDNPLYNSPWNVRFGFSFKKRKEKG
ncbi:outer membrane protein transport protein [Reichenbachiella carrageenanivorans]|uniref:Outer membrane protein transport protein n=1 Tax=Reichenbachiella carrageenanivorans TaxID=2979869 RepID=A0ABY6D153_9BACT|nr:outer membrane protein transport protein [Reichenbachiella carrageenanivorans]UXX79429.1 outer membrane protein transport protein [Reichenbachiella carrageenanivorans]